MLNLERITQCTIIGCVCLGPKVGEVILHGSSQWDSCYAITHSLTTLHWRNIGLVLGGMDLQLDWGSTFPTIFSSLRPFHKHSPSSSWPVIAFWWWFRIFVVFPVFLQFSYFTITVSHHFSNFQCHPLWQKRKYTILIFGIWHPTALLRKELFIIFHNRCIFIIATILLRFQKSVCLRFHKKCSARKKTRKTTICSSGCTIRVISFNQIFTSDSFKNLSLLFFTQAWND